MLFSRFAKSAAALFLATIGFAAPVHAQQNKQIISGNWYEDRASAVSSTGSLILTFTQTPANQFVNFTNISCYISLFSGQVLTGVFLYAGQTPGSDDLGRAYNVRGNVTPESIGTGKFYSVVTNQIFYKFGPGRFPSIEIDTQTTGSTATNASCVIVGNLTDN
jgi:hypothetical protein